MDTVGRGIVPPVGRPHLQHRIEGKGQHHLFRHRFVTDEQVTVCASAITGIGLSSSMKPVRTLVHDQFRRFCRFCKKLIRSDCTALQIFVPEFAASIRMVFPERCLEQAEAGLVEQGGPFVYGIGIGSYACLRDIPVSIVQISYNIADYHIPAVLGLIEFLAFRFQDLVNPRHLPVFDQLVEIEICAEQPRYPGIVVPDIFRHPFICVVLDEIVYIPDAAPVPGCLRIGRVCSHFVGISLYLGCIVHCYIDTERISPSRKPVVESVCIVLQTRLRAEYHIRTCHILRIFRKVTGYSQKEYRT